MIRIVVENAFVFLLPTLAYITWVAFKKNDWPGIWSVLRDAPLVKLLASGAVLMLLTLAIFSSRTGHAPGESYQPKIFKDGQLQPGETRKP
jgi:hypothetical protein